MCHSSMTVTVQTARMNRALRVLQQNRGTVYYIHLTRITTQTDSLQTSQRNKVGFTMKQQVTGKYQGHLDTSKTGRPRTKRRHKVQINRNTKKNWRMCKSKDLRKAKELSTVTRKNH